MDYWPDVIQAIPTDDFKVYVYFDDGTIRLFDASEVITRGIFKPLSDINLFKDTCTVLNNTLAWTLDKNYDPTTCIDLDPFVLYDTCPVVEENMELFSYD